MVEFNLELYGERVSGPQRGSPVRLRFNDRLQDPKTFSGGVLLDQAGAVDEKDEGRGRAIHNGHFRPVQLDYHIVHATAGERRHQVLDGRNLGAALTYQSGAERGLDGIIPGRRHLRAVKVGTAEHDTAASLCRTQGQAHFLSEMQADPGTMN